MSPRDTRQGGGPSAASAARPRRALAPGSAPPPDRPLCFLGVYLPHLSRLPSFRAICVLPTVCSRHETSQAPCLKGGGGGGGGGRVAAEVAAASARTPSTYNRGGGDGRGGRGGVCSGSSEREVRLTQPTDGGALSSRASPATTSVLAKRRWPFLAIASMGRSRQGVAREGRGGGGGWRKRWRWGQWRWRLQWSVGGAGRGVGRAPQQRRRGRAHSQDRRPAASSSPSGLFCTSGRSRSGCQPSGLGLLGAVSTLFAENVCLFFTCV